MRLSPTEADDQAALFEWAARAAPRLPALALLLHVPNGGHRHKAVAARLHAQGVKSGVPDLFLPVPRAPHAGLWIEMKRRSGGALTAHQRWWTAVLAQQGYRVEVCRGWEAAREAILNYLEAL